MTDPGRAPHKAEDGLEAELESVLEGCRASHARLLETVAALDEAGVRAPSRLEGWSVGHALTHLARNADSHTRMLRAALGGEAVEQYAGGRKERASAIEAGALRPVTELRDDVNTSTGELEAAWTAMTALAWEGNGLSHGHVWPCRSLPYFRWREVEIHHVDLGTGYDIHNWPEQYVRRELPLALDTLPDRLGDGAQRRRLLAWLIGRAQSPGELDLASWESQRGNYFRGITD